MSEKENSFFSQVRRNAVALISLIVAVSSLSYNPWRNEKTGPDRNHRVAAFEVLMKLGELEQVVFLHHYDRDIADRGNARAGWSYFIRWSSASGIPPRHRV